jgi:hypothetical protein
MVSLATCDKWRQDDAQTRQAAINLRDRNRIPARQQEDDDATSGRT